MKQAHRFSAPGQPYEGLTVLGKHGPRWTGAARFVPDMLGAPLSWRKPKRVFVNSMSDLFHEDVTNDQIAAVFGVMAACERHVFQVLTKRPERARVWFDWYESDRDPNRFRHPELIEHAACMGGGERLFAEANRCAGRSTWPLPNVWLGVSCEDQQRADERVPLLIECPAAVRFVSAEPLLGPIDFGSEWLTHWLGRYPFPTLGNERRTKFIHLLDWLIVGGESGHGARECDIAWVRSIVEQCNQAGVACFVKQLGYRVTENRGLYGEAVTGTRAGEVYAARIEHDRGGTVRRWFHPLDRKGGDMAEFPEDLRVRQFPREARV